MAIRISTPVVELLQARGLLPQNCRSVSLSIPASGAMVLTFEQLVTTEHMAILGDAFTQQAEIAEREEHERAAMREQEQSKRVD